MLTVRYEELRLAAGQRLLDIGCGAGRHSFEALKRGVSTVSADIDDAVLKDVGAWIAAMRAEGQIAPHVSSASAAADALHLPFGDESFDRVIASEVLEHIREDERAMAEIARVTKMGGLVAVSVPRAWPEAINWALSRSYRTSAGGHVRIYRRGQLKQRLFGAGLVPISTHHAHALHSPFWWIRSLTGEDSRISRAYHRILVRDIESPMAALRTAERILDPALGKSLVVYARRTG